MGRIFGRGELKEAVVAVLASLGEAHGYGIMGELKERVGGGWKPSPGAIYPALLALVDAGYVEFTERDGSRIYSLTEAGQRSARKASSEARWTSLTERAETGDQRVSLGSMLDRFAAESPVRRRLAGTTKKQEIEAILARTQREIEESLSEGEDDG